MFVYALGWPGDSPLRPSYERVRDDPTWTTHELDGKHNLMRDKPDELLAQPLDGVVVEGRVYENLKLARYYASTSYWDAEMGRILEAGAQGIMYPRCESAEEAAEVVRWAKFAPLGERGVDGANPDNPYCAMPMPPYLKAANENTLLITQLESPKALDAADAIA